VRRQLATLKEFAPRQRAASFRWIVLGTKKGQTVIDLFEK
jgi:hypothetical protein